MASNLITVGELLLYPTGLNWDTLAERIGLNDEDPTAPAQAVEQAQIIKIASEHVANYCNMPRGLHATQQTETTRIARTAFFGTKAWSDKDGWLRFKAENLPVLSVDSMAYAMSPGPVVWTDITPDMSAIINGRYPQFFQISENAKYWGWTKSSATMLQVKYTAGYGNTVLLSAVTAGTNKAVTVESTLGFATANTQNPEMLDFQKAFNIYDGPNTEMAVPIISIDGPTTMHISPSKDHDPTTGDALTSGIGISTLPVSIKLATIMLAVHYARARGAQAMVMNAARGQLASKSSADLVTDAEFALEPWVVKI